MSPAARQTISRLTLELDQPACFSANTHGTALLANGSAEERDATLAGELSPLFAGGMGERVRAVVTLAAPSDGMTAYEAEAPSLLPLFRDRCHKIVRISSYLP